MSEYQGPDPHDIVPEDFPYESLTAARQDIEADYLHTKRCPECGSTNITPLSTKATSGTEEDWKCKKCYSRFNTPRQSRYDEQMERFERMAESRAERDRGSSWPDEHEQASLEEVAR